MSDKGDMIPLLDLLSLKGKRALVTGAAAGIGRAISVRLAETGADLYLVDINEEGLRDVQREIKGKFDVSIEIFKVDLSKREEIINLWKAIEGREPDILINNAGIYLFQDFLEVDEKFLEKTLSVNLKSAF